MSTEDSSAFTCPDMSAINYPPDRQLSARQMLCKLLVLMKHATLTHYCVSESKRVGSDTFLEANPCRIQRFILRV